MAKHWPVKAASVVLLLFLGLDSLFPVNTSVPYSTIITARDGSILHAFLSRDDKWRMYAELSEITPALRDAILYKEDKYFRYHPGFNPVSMLRAAGRNLLTGRRTSGASTITMQTVRLLEPRLRTYVNKGIELFRAVQLEVHYSKDEILQLYLNLIPYGGNIEGLKSASLLYFGKPPVLLSLAELTTLTIIPNRPSSLRLGIDNARVVQERNRWLHRFRAARVYDETTIADALAEPLTAYRHDAPQLAPHLSRRLRTEQPDQPIIRSSLNPATQSTAEQLVRNYANRIRVNDIHNGAVLIVDNRTQEVIAYVGSADFGNAVDGGQVDGVRAVRSPGSALKPLLYGLAFDAGIITPKTKLNDVPTNFGGYEPDNYDRQFNGPITAEFALANSLNIPAVALLKEMGTPALVSTLQKASFSTVRKQSRDLGLSMILGGCGVTLEEMTRLYVGLANGGRMGALQWSYPTPSHPLKEKKGERAEPSGRLTPSPKRRGGAGAVRRSGGVRILSPEAAYLVTNTLTQITRPDLPNNFDNSYHLPRIAWKTGTSYGRRDAWSIGYNQRYTIGVWVGNFSGVGVAELSGANTATPLLFQLFNALDYNSPSGWFQAPAGANSLLARRLICPETGDVPGDSCQNPVTDYHIMGVSRHRPCQHRKTVFTNSAGTLTYCPHCRPDSGWVRRSYPNLAPDMVAYYQSRHVPFEPVPPHNPTCERVSGMAGTTRSGPLITSLNEGSEYFINPRRPAELELGCQAANDVQMVFWYLNDKLYRRARPTEAVFFRPRPGSLKISCADDQGRHSDLRVLVKAE